MNTPTLRKLYKLFTVLFCLLLLGQSGVRTSTAQTPHQDATRPPGSQQPLPAPVGPSTSDPTAPPGARISTPTTHPTPAPASKPVQPVAGATPSATPAESPEPDLTTSFVMSPEVRTVPPMPSLSRIGVNSGNVISLSLREAIRRALENNTEIELAQTDVRLNELMLPSLEGLYQPIFDVTPQWRNSVSPSFSALSGADSSGTVSQSEMSVDTFVSRRLRRGGGNYRFFFNNQRQSSSSSFNQFNPFYSASLGLTYVQPLMRGRAIDDARRSILVQRKRIEHSDLEFRRRVTDVISRVENAYWELMFALRNQQNRVANLDLARENFRDTEQRIQAGTSAPIERVEVQTVLASREAEVLFASQTVSAAENLLKELILNDPLAPEWSAVIIPTDRPAFDELPLNLEQALTEARANRPELRRLSVEQDINRLNLRYLKDQTKPRLDLQMTYATTGLAGSSAFTRSPGSSGSTSQQVPLISGSPSSNADAFLLEHLNQMRAAQGLEPIRVPNINVRQDEEALPSNLTGGYGQMLRNLFSFNTRTLVVGVAIQLPWRNRTAEADLGVAKLQQSQLETLVSAQELAVQREVRNAVQSVETARRAVLAARTARESAHLQLRSEKELYQVGRSTTFLLVQRENQLVNARNSELRAETDYNKSLVELRRATFTTMSTYIVEVSAMPER